MDTLSLRRVRTVLLTPCAFGQVPSMRKKPSEVAKANAEYIGYSTPQTEARRLLDPEVGENADFYPPKELPDKTKTFITLPDEINALQGSLWIKLKQKTICPLSRAI